MFRGSREAFRRHWSAAAAGVAAAASLAVVPTQTVSAGSVAKEQHWTTTPIACEDGTTVTPWSTPGRESQLKQLQEQKFDVLVIGAGATGSGVALDAATRGLKVAIVDANDFCAGTSSRSTKLIHGGIRYLEQAFKGLDPASFSLVMEALRERGYMLRAAPYMNSPLPIMIPLYRWWEVPYMWVGAKVYDLVAAGEAVPPSFFIGRTEAMFRFPMLRSDGLKGAIVYYDGQMNDARLGTLVALTAVQAGATAANYTRVVSLLRAGGQGNGAGGESAEGEGAEQQRPVVGATLRDELSGETFDVRARVVVNCTGPFADGVRRMADHQAREAIAPAGGVHVVLPDHFCPDKMGLIVPETKDGRVLFFLPWEGSTLCGTTDSITDLTIEPKPTEKEVQFILDEANRFLQHRVGAQDVEAAWSGIRPLVRDLSKPDDTDTKSFLRTHTVEQTAPGLLSVMGGKWTTFRQMAEDAVDAVVAADPHLASAAGKCVTLEHQLLGADRAGIVVGKKFDRITVTLRTRYGLPKDVAKHLLRNYGTRALQIAELVARDSSASARLAQRLAPTYPFLAAEVVFAVQQEYACKAVDVLARRTRLAFLNAEAARAAAPEVVAIMASELGWSQERQRQELADVEHFLTTMK